MAERPAAGVRRELAVKASVRKFEFYCADEITPDPALEKSEREIDEITAAEYFDERSVLAFAYAMVEIDHRRDFFSPVIATRAFEVTGSKVYRRREIIPCIR